ncbi:FAD-binding protein [Adlercreutzia sp. R25]|uniref:FAD-dependent oxidoreductase n=1 Tax=Adlercreutzia shanghongiae TaxID=3111773 RepID=UPI002DBFF452|nr:FAD-binding protein [Adlercreutzia sp. R25]MEC4271864.1 FAD-binding protein [Adlercreutzia sp. R25]
MIGNNQVSRRTFMKTASAGMLGLAALGMTAGCAPKGQDMADTNGAAGSGAPESWDGEYDFVVVGSGTAMIGALTAASQGAKVAIVEKGSQLGGTTRLSGAGARVPKNQKQVAMGLGEDLSDEEIMGYMEACDVYNGSTRETKQDYLDHAAAVFEWCEENLGMVLDSGPVGDYTSLPGSKRAGRSISPVDANGEMIVGEQLFGDILIPQVEQNGIVTYLDTEATELVLGEGGAVIGVKAKDGSSDLFLKAEKGVLLGAGGFEHNDAMREAFMSVPLYGSLGVAENTGDGHRMGVAAGAALANMESYWGCPFYVLGDGTEMVETATDWGDYAGLPGAIMVNAAGKRFTDESSGYPWMGMSFGAFDAKTCSVPNLPAYLVFDTNHVASFGWPANEESQPEWLGEYATLEELAAGCGIDAAGLAAEVERYNRFCDTGVDEDFDRGKSNYTSLLEFSLTETPEMPNIWLAKIATAPFYAVRIGPGTIGTCGGLNVNADSQVLDYEGSPIEGLYSCGNNAANIFGSAYPGATATTGQGYYRGFKAANHALNLGLLG